MTNDFEWYGPYLNVRMDQREEDLARKIQDERKSWDQKLTEHFGTDWVGHIGEIGATKYFYRELKLGTQWEYQNTERGDSDLNVMTRVTRAVIPLQSKTTARRVAVQSDYAQTINSRQVAHSRCHHWILSSYHLDTRVLTIVGGITLPDLRELPNIPEGTVLTPHNKVAKQVGGYAKVPIYGKHVMAFKDWLRLVLEVTIEPEGERRCGNSGNLFPL